MVNTLSLSTSKTAQTLSLNSSPAKRPIGAARHNERFSQSESRSPAPNNGKIHYIAEIERYSRLPTSGAGTSNYEPADLILIRGLPGSGKSTIARTLKLGGYHRGAVSGVAANSGDAEKNEARAGCILPKTCRNPTSPPRSNVS